MTNQTYQTILVDRNIDGDSAIARITLNRPDRMNTFNQKMRLEMLEAVTELESDQAVRVVIIKGAGRLFSAGADLQEAAPYPISNQIDYEYKPFIEKIHHGSKLYIAQVHKNASGAGGGLAMACDFLVMDDAATIYTAFAAIALVPDCGTTWQLLHSMGRRRALQSILECNHMSAQECLDSGLANKVVPADELESTTLEWAKNLAKVPNETAAATKRLLHDAPFASLKDAMSNEAHEQVPLIVHDNFKQAVAKFFSKGK